MTRWIIVLFLHCLALCLKILFETITLMITMHILRDPTGIFEKTCMKKCQEMQKKMLNNANFKSKNMKNMLKSRDVVHNPDN